MQGCELAAPQLAERHQRLLSGDLTLVSGTWLTPELKLAMCTHRKYLLRFQCSFAFQPWPCRHKAKLIFSQETGVSTYISEQRQKERVTGSGHLMVEEDIAYINTNHTCRENPGTREQ